MIRNKRNMRFLKLAFLLLSAVFVLFYHSNAVAYDFIVEEKDKLVQVIKQGHSPLAPVFSYISGYAAIREDNLVFCDRLGAGGEKCRKVVRDYDFLKRTAEGQCGKLLAWRKELEGEEKADYDDMQLFCKNSDDCDKQAIQEYKDMCYGLKAGSVSLLIQSQDGVSEKSARGQLGIYKGFKNGRSKGACEIYAEQLHGCSAYLCEVMFSDEPINDILDGVAQDLAYVLLADTYEDKSLCKDIKNENIREGCLSKKSVGGYFGIEDYSPLDKQLLEEVESPPMSLVQKK